jgi:C1A family cysteine protease
MSDDFEIKIPEPAAPGTLFRLGRMPAIDSRDRRFSVAAKKTDRTFRSWLAPGTPFNQGNTPQCVAYSANGYLVSHRIVNKPVNHAELYKLCQENDEWDGTDYEGTSVRAAMRVLKQSGYISSYNWAFEPEAVIRHLLEVSPVILGVDWLEGMWDTDKDGYIHATGSAYGGHAILAVAVNRNRINPDETKGAIRLLNSWGRGWGDKGSGRAWLGFNDLALLMKGIDPRWPGEAATATELRVR